MLDKVNRLTLGEIAKVEELSGMSIRAMGDDNAPMGKLMAALLYVTKRRKDLTFKWDDALNLTMDEVTSMLGMDDEPEADTADPTPAP